MEVSQCKRMIMTAWSRNLSVLVIKALDCHRVDCPSCLADKVKHNLSIINLEKRKSLEIATIPAKKYSTARKSIYRAGSFYWACPQIDGTVVVVLDKKTKHTIGSVSVTDKKSLETQVARWVSSRGYGKRISHSRVDSEKKPTNREVWATRIRPRNMTNTIKGIMEMYGLIETKKGVYEAGEGVSKESVAEALDMIEMVLDGKSVYVEQEEMSQ